MPIRLTGMNSGLDTEAIISALVSNVKTKKESFQKKQTKLTWTQDAWKDLNKKVYSLYTNVSNLRLSSAYNLKKTTSSDTTKATITAGNKAVNGSQKLNIIKVAQAGFLTGGKIANSATEKTTLSELGYVGGEASINVEKGDGSKSTIKLDSSSTIEDVVKQLKDAGLNASFDSNNHRFYVSAQTTGVENDFNLIGSDDNGLMALSKLGLSTSLISGTDDSGNPIYTEVGKTYQKYAAFATDGSGNLLTEDEIKNNIKDALGVYKDASDALTAKENQKNDYLSGIQYAKTYGEVQKFCEDKNITDTDRFLNVMSAYAEKSSSFVGSNGNIYNPTNSVDDKGNALFKDKDGNYVSKEVIYTDTDGKTYHKDSDGKYVSTEDSSKFYEGTEELEESYVYHEVTENTHEYTDTNGNAIPCKVEANTVDGVTKYSITIDGKTYESDTTEGEFKASDDSTITISKKYSYTQNPGDNVLAYEQVTDAYKKYVDDNNLSEEDVTALKEKLTKINAFESQAASNEEKKQIKNDVHNAYSAAPDVTSIDDLVKNYSAKVAGLTTEIEDLQKTLEENSIVKDLASIKDDAELDKTLTQMAKTAQTAANQLKNGLDDAGAAIKMNGQNAVIKLNDVEYENATNGIEVNGITINALAATGDGDENAITITTSTDTQGIYDKIKDFLSEYNQVINEMCKLYNAEWAKGYEPLTDDQKDEMSDKEIEKWEQKIKDSILRHDGTLNGIITAMTGSMMKSFTINDKKFSLSSFGIQTLGSLNSAANENYAYHIDGDADDEKTSGKTDKLMAAITSDPESVMSFFKELTSDLYKTLGDKMRRTDLSSSYTIYNDKQMDKQQTQYKKLIKEWETKFTEKEDYYYKKFAAMESAMAKLNSTQSSMSGFFGM